MAFPLVSRSYSRLNVCMSCVFYNAFPCIVLTLLELLFNDFLLITVYRTEFIDFFTLTVCLVS